MAKKEKLRVIGWTKYSPEYKEWYEVHGNDESVESVELIVMNEIKKRKFKFGGNYHQYGEFGCPVMSDGTIFLSSMRGWGGIMADVWGGDYCCYAWNNVEDLKGGKAPTEADSATPIKYTKEELEERDRKRQEAQKQIQKELAERRKEEEKQLKEDKTVLRDYLAKLLDKYEGRKDELVKFLANDIIGIADRYHCKPMDCHMKWVLYKSERNRVSKEAAKHRKEWLAKFKESAGTFKDFLDSTDENSEPTT